MTEIKPFTELLKKSFQRANKSWPKLSGVLLIISAFFAAYALALFILSFWIQGALLRGMPLRTEHILEFLVLLVGIYALLRWNGAIAYAFAVSTTDEFAGEPIFRVAKKSWKNGIGFFINSFNTGMLILFGQTLAICPCFLMQSNFIFSPYLYVYEGLKNRAARKRARELTKGFGWVVLQRSSIFLLIGYLVIAIIFLSIFAPHPIIFITIALLLAMYASSIQSHFLREIYLESKEHHAAAHDSPPKRTWIISSTVVAVIVIIVYYSIKFGLHLVSLRN